MSFYNDQYAGRDINVRQLVGDEEQYNRQEVKQQSHAGSEVPFLEGRGRVGGKIRRPRGGRFERSTILNRGRAGSILKDTIRK